METTATDWVTVLNQQAQQWYSIITNRPNPNTSTASVQVGNGTVSANVSQSGILLVALAIGAVLLLKK